MKKYNKQKGITLIALIITIIVLLILAGVVIYFTAGQDGIINRANEAAFKTRMSQLAENANLSIGWQVTETLNTDTSNINAGIMLSDMISLELLDITDDNITFDIDDLIADVKDEEKEYIAVYKGEFYYVSSKDIENDEIQKKWCEEIGIKILNYQKPTGIQVATGSYENVKGVYLCTPQLNDGINKKVTRYLNIDSKGNLIPGDWVNKRPSDDWYDYKKQQWANIYIENNGSDIYYTWIPRYAYKLDQENEKSEVRFIDSKDNSWIEVKEDGAEIKHEWAELQKDGFEIPESFTWTNEKEQTVNLAGYWVSKYTLGELESYALDYEMISNITSITVRNIKCSSSASKYTYAINGVIEKTLDKATEYTFTNLKAGDNTINVTALNSAGEIVGSMTKIYSPAIVNKPDLSGFNQDTTFYVYWDEKGVEHNEIPITKEPPANWYEYGARIWANIVTRNNGQETYYTWIPRYEYTLDQTSQRSIVKFIQGTGTETSAGGYEIPESFTWTNDAGEKVELPGYWVTKYTLGDETAPRFDTEMVTTQNSIKTKGITGTEVSTNQKYKYYIDGEYKGEKTKATDTYEFKGLQEGKTYTINIIVRNSSTNEYLGAITKQVKVVPPNAPDLTGFNQDKTYYVTYDSNGTEHSDIKISQSAPSDWYDYSENKWANIVVKTEDATTYYTWIPRYEYKILPTQYKNESNQRVEVRWLKDKETNASPEYEIPESFTWKNDKGEPVELTGYWVTKYTLGDKNQS